MLHNQNSANFAHISLIIPTFVPSVLPQNGTKNKRGTREYAQQLIIKELNFRGYSAKGQSLARTD